MGTYQGHRNKYAMINKAIGKEIREETCKEICKGDCKEICKKIAEKKTPTPKKIRQR